MCNQQKFGSKIFQWLIVTESLKHISFVHPTDASRVMYSQVCIFKVLRLDVQIDLFEDLINNYCWISYMPA